MFNIKKLQSFSIILFGTNLFILIVVPLVFFAIFKMFPNLDSTENGLGAYPLLAIILGLYGIFVTGAFVIVMFILNIMAKWFKKNDTTV